MLFKYSQYSLLFFHIRRFILCNKNLFLFSITSNKKTDTSVNCFKTLFDKMENSDDQSQRKSRSESSRRIVSLMKTVLA